jgi:hypothetical protein
MKCIMKERVSLIDRYRHTSTVQWSTVTSRIWRWHFTDDSIATFVILHSGRQRGHYTLQQVVMDGVNTLPNKQT